MKVDKAVCTSNDAYFAENKAANELNSIIKFETVFSKLVENKILAIKRECEEQESKKKERSLKSCISKNSDEIQEPFNGVEVKKKKKHKSFLLCHKNKQPSEVDVERGEKQDNEALDVPSTDGAELVKVEVQNDKVNGNQGLVKNVNEPSNVDSQSNEHVATPINLPGSSEKPDEGKQNCDKLIVNNQTENAQLSLSTNNSSSAHSNKTIKELSPPSEKNNKEQNESLATTADISLQQQSSVVALAKTLPISSDRSVIAICDDGVSSQNTSDIEFSLVSESIGELPIAVRKKTSTNSDPIIKKPAHFLSPPLKREVKISERKAISCQSTPLFGRHQKAQSKSEGGGEVKKVLTFQKELPKKVCEPKPIEKVKSQTIVIAPTSTTTTTTLAKPISASSPVEAVHANKKSQKRKYRDVSVEYEISYDDSDGNPRGFISSFNQLTSQKPPTAVITTNPKKQSLKHSKVHSSKDVKKQLESIGGSVDDKNAKPHDIELELDELAIDVINKRKTKKSKF